MIEAVKGFINKLKDGVESGFYYVKNKFVNDKEKVQYQMDSMSKKLKKLDGRIRDFYLKNEISLADLKKNMFYLDLSRELVFNLTDVVVGLRMMYILYKNDYNSSPIESIIRDYLNFLKKNVDPINMFNESEDSYLISYATSVYAKYLFDVVSSVYAAQHWKEFIAKMVEFFDNFNRNLNYFYFFYAILSCDNCSYLIEDALRVINKYYKCIVVCSIYKHFDNRDVNFARYKIRKIKLNKRNKINQFLNVFDMYNRGEYGDIVEDYVVFKS